jgi:hypothetical protein
MALTVSLFDGTSRLTGKRLDYIKYFGIIDLDNLYREIVKWFKDRKYDFYETLYKDKPPELELEWHAERKVDDFYRYIIEIYFHFYDIEEIDVIQHGVKKKMIRSRVWIKIEPFVELDYQDRWSDTAFKKALFTFYFNNIIKREFLLLHADKLWYISYRLHKRFKELLGMETATNAY